MSVDPSGAPPGTSVRASLTAVGGVVAAVGLMLLLVTWAASIGPQQVVHDEGTSSTSSALPSSPTASPSGTGGTGRQLPVRGHQDVLFTVLTFVAVLLAVLMILAVSLSALPWLLTWRRERSRRRREPEPLEVAFDPLEAPAKVAAELVRDARAQRQLLEEGSPRNAIVACWHRFEQQAAAAGVRRRDWETSSEFTIRILDRLSADSAAVLHLADLYRLARHSDHAVTEADRAAALDALDAVHRSLSAVSTGDRS